MSDALRAFRKPDTIVPPWADAICINQKDNDEKTCQVPLMGKIYGQASNVKTWLGEESQEEDCKMAFQLIGKLYTVSLGYKDGKRPIIHLQYTLATLGLPEAGGAYLAYSIDPSSTVSGLSKRSLWHRRPTFIVTNLTCHGRSSRVE
jgi:hypothetical protein